MAQCSGPISPAENPPGPSGLNQVEQEKEKSPQQPSRSGLFENSSQEYIENAESYMESAPQMYEDSDSDDGMDVVYGPNPPSGSRIIQRPLYNQDCPTNTTSCNLPRPSSSRGWNHEGEHYGYSYPSYPRLSRVHPQDYSNYYDPPPSFRQSRYMRAWTEASQSTQSSSRYPHSDPNDPYDLGYPPILRHPPNRPRPRRHNLDVANPRIPYHTRPPVEIDMDYLDYDQGPQTSLAENIRRSAIPNPDIDLASVRNIRQDQQRQVIMRHASTSTPPMPSLRQHASTSTQPSDETCERKRSSSKQESLDEVSAKRARVEVSPQSNSEENVSATEESESHAAGLPTENISDVCPDAPAQESPEEFANFLLCSENLPEEDADNEGIVPASQEIVPAPSSTVDIVVTTVSSSSAVLQAETVLTSVETTPGNMSSTTTKSSSIRTEPRTVPASAIEFVTSTLKPRSKPGSNQTSRKTSPNTSRASPVHVAAYSQEALRDLVCATLAPAAAANLIKSEKREKKDRESSTRTSPDPIDDPQPGPSGLQRLSSEEQPGPSGSQQQSSPASDLQADDLQLDCLSSDTEGSSSEDVQVVKISRRKKSSKKPVEVDLTQEMTSDDDGEVVIEEVRSRPVSAPINTTESSSAEDPENKTEITVKTFASVPENITNIQSSSRGSTPAAPTTLFDTYQQHLASTAGVDSAWAGAGPPPYHHRDHGYHRHNRHPESRAEAVRQSRTSIEPPIDLQRPIPVDLRPEDPVVMETEERPEAAITDPWLHDMHYRPRRLRHPCVYRQGSSHSCPTACPCSRQDGRHQNQHPPSWSLGSSSRPSAQAGHQSQYTNPPPAHRASLCPNTNAMDPHSIMTSQIQLTGSRPGSLLRAVQRMNPRHQRLYHMQQQTTEQHRRWSVRAPPPPYPSTASNAAAEVSSADQAPATAAPNAAASATCTEGSTAQAQHQEPQSRQEQQPTASAHTAGHLLSVPRVIMSRPTPFPLHRHIRRGHSHSAATQQYMGPPNQSVPPPPVAGRPGINLERSDPPPAHQPPPARFPEEVQLPDSRRVRPRDRRWHIPTMGDPHPPYHHPEVEPVPLVMDHPMYHPPPYPPNMIPPNAHHGSMGPVMDPLQLDPAGVPLGRENLAYGPMLNILFQPHRMGGLEVQIIDSI